MKENTLFGAIRTFFVYSGDDLGDQLTGVARYLQENNLEPQPKIPTSVDRYLETKEITEVRIAEALAETSYQQELELENQRLAEQAELARLKLTREADVYESTLKQASNSNSGGLFGAIRSFFIYDGSQFGSKLTGVARYLQEHNIEPDVIAEPDLEAQSLLCSELTTGVARYLEHVALTETPPCIDATEETDEIIEVVETVADIEQEVVSEAVLHSEATAGVTRFLEQAELSEASLSTAAEVVAEAIENMSNTEDVESVLESDIASVAVLRSKATTGVARYLEQTDAGELRISAATELVAEAVSAITAVESENLEIQLLSDELVAEKTIEALEDEPVITLADEEQADIKDELLLITGVEMYLQDQLELQSDQMSSTGVGAYLDEINVHCRAEAILAKYQQQDEVIQEPIIVTSSVANYIEENGLGQEIKGSTGVVDYLEQSAKQAESEVIIANYLARQQALVEATLPEPSSVAQYINRYEQEASNNVNTAVEKAVMDTKVTEIIACFHERERIAKEQQQKLEPPANRVSVVKIRHRKPSSVTCYIAQRDLAECDTSKTLSNVGKFLKEKEVADILSRFLAQQEEANKAQKAPLSGVATYIADLVENEPAPQFFSGVSQYLVNQPATTIIEAPPVPALETSVEKYIQEQEVVDALKMTSSVDQYLANLIIEASRNSAGISRPEV